MSTKEIRNYAAVIMAAIALLSGLQLLVPETQAGAIQMHANSEAGRGHTALARPDSTGRRHAAAR